jgi:hypothetical protein
MWATMLAGTPERDNTSAGHGVVIGAVFAGLTHTVRS